MEVENGICFIMQPFDKGKFDKRFDDVIKPSVAKANIEPYRVDRDASVSVPISEIESGIKKSIVCLAEITTDNPNVWFELGYALALNKDVVLICSNERTTKYPFDVQHRNIISYDVDAPRDFGELGSKITARLKALLKKQSSMEAIHAVTKDIQGLAPHEIATLTTLMTYRYNSYSSIEYYYLNNEMESAGFNSLATTLSIQSLINKKFIQEKPGRDADGDPVTFFGITEAGSEWLFANQDTLVLKK